MGHLDLLGTCPKCGGPVFDDSAYEYDEQADEYWHVKCLRESDKGYE